jgi:formylglycine-generating enzyme required for sulfatase activity
VFDLAPPSGMPLIPAGSFTMGDTLGDGEAYELPAHTVYVSAFYMEKNLVSYVLWQQVYQWATSHDYVFDHAGSGKAPNHPVQTVSWHDAVKWCNARSEMEGLTPCYYYDASQTMIYRSGQGDLETNCVNWVANGYRLPTEAEWEKAARGGLAGHRFPWTDVDTIDWSQANYYACPSCFLYDVNSTEGYDAAFADGVFPYTSPVGYFAPNGYGLYDMVGNVWEWCWDWYNSMYYSSSPGTDPRGPSPDWFLVRVLRGGSWAGGANSTRCASRYGTWIPGESSTDFGFRCVRGF